MSINTLSPKASATKLRRTLLVVPAVSILIAIALLVVWLVLPRGQVTIWMERSKSWLLFEIQGPFTPTEELLILSSAFSVVVSMVLEALLLFALRNKSKQTKTWLRFTLYAILFANAALAFTAFLYASVSTTISGKCGNITGDVVLDEYGHYRKTNARTFDLIELGQSNSYDKAFPCGRKMVSRWLSLLISLFSIVLLVSAWLDFREQDLKESETSQHDGKLDGEKGVIEIDFIESIV
ncbi:uncharacterized protein GGS22DRAFT_18274 [Annulohypoxylon maeteangense]|uniref:uncharacterized protein n=1 Tax=Annulohypoxylon maeteangense TaxID=1927788 RepID=UPI002008670E|nr:uncharacterized protein GGS22DRAFT_18274 [Annulohypoxylon maeteangense]KAI0884036.1 hypothetical protein GGS22DRAFT_18274 [Annulohypoxylon maeteangense]